MRVKKHFRTSVATTEHIIADFSYNIIIDRDGYFLKCVGDRINLLSNEYNSKVDKILNFIILSCEYSNMPLTIISKIVYSLSKVTTAVSKGIMSIIKE